MRQLTLTEIWIYPIKSLGGIPLRRSIVQEKGLQLDRRWMLVDEDGTFMTQRVNPLMSLFKLSIRQGELNIIFKHPDDLQHPSITFDINRPPSGELRQVKIWNDTVLAMEVDQKISEWFSEHLGFNCSLVNFPEGNPRPVDPQYSVNDEQVSLADAYPFLIIGQSSLDDLNTRLDKPVPMNRFRPNFVYAGGEPYEEDRWENFIIGTNRFVGVKPCARCVLTTVNQDTAEKGSEPLATLSSYRKENNKVLFGQNLVAIDHGEVAVGDQIILS